MLHESFSCSQYRYSDFVDPRNIDSSIIIHCPYNVTLFNKNTHNLRVSIQTLKDILKTKCRYAVMHMGSCPTTITDFISQGRYLYNSIDNNDKPRVLLENSAGERNVMGYNMSQLGAIFRAFPLFGFCLDTQHSFGAGLIDFRKNWEHKFDKLNSKFGIKVIHINDSVVEFGKRKDSHEDLGHGHIWKDNEEELRKLVIRCASNNIIMVCETHNSSDDLNKVKEFVRQTM